MSYDLFDLLTSRIDIIIINKNRDVACHWKAIDRCIICLSKFEVKSYNENMSRQVKGQMTDLRLTFIDL